MGIAGLMTINSGRLLKTCRIEAFCPPLFVTTTVAAELDVFTVTDPKLSEAGLTPTPAWIGVDKNSELTKNNPRDRHTSRVVCMRGNPSCLSSVQDQNGAEGMSLGNRDSYFRREDTTGGRVRFRAAVLSFSGCDLSWARAPTFGAVYDQSTIHRLPEKSLFGRGV